MNAKLVACILLLAITFFTSCKKDELINGNKPQIANAGADQTITLPKDSVLLNGSTTIPLGNSIFYYPLSRKIAYLQVCA
jgi:hypothetical protein